MVSTWKLWDEVEFNRESLIPEHIYIYTKEMHPKPEVVEKINEALRSKNIDPTKINLVEQTNCPKCYAEHIHDRSNQWRSY